VDKDSRSLASLGAGFAQGILLHKVGTGLQSGPRIVHCDVDVLRWRRPNKARDTKRGVQRSNIVAIKAIKTDSRTFNISTKQTSLTFRAESQVIRDKCIDALVEWWRPDQLLSSKRYKLAKGSSLRDMAASIPKNIGGSASGTFGSSSLHQGSASGPRKDGNQTIQDEVRAPLHRISSSPSPLVEKDQKPSQALGTRTHSQPDLKSAAAPEAYAPVRDESAVVEHSLSAFSDFGCSPASGASAGASSMQDECFSDDEAGDMEADAASDHQDIGGEEASLSDLDENGELLDQDDGVTDSVSAYQSGQDEDGEGSSSAVAAHAPESPSLLDDAAFKDASTSPSIKPDPDNLEREQPSADPLKIWRSIHASGAPPQVARLESMRVISSSSRLGDGAALPKPSSDSIPPPPPELLHTGGSSNSHNLVASLKRFNRSFRNAKNPRGFREEFEKNEETPRNRNRSQML